MIAEQRNLAMSVADNVPEAQKLCKQDHEGVFIFISREVENTHGLDYAKQITKEVYTLSDLKTTGMSLTQLTELQRRHGYRLYAIVFE